MNANMDDVRERMIRLIVGLQEFNAQLLQSVQEINDSHERVNPLWQDSMRRDYDARWLPLKETLDAYINQVGPQYVETLHARLAELHRYLYGD